MASNPFGNPAEDFVYLPINLDEPVPAANRKETMFGLIISFLVRSIAPSFRLANGPLPCHQFLSWVCCSLRLYTRLVIVRAAWWDDLFVALYLVSRHSLPSVKLPLLTSLPLQITTTAGCIAICVCESLTRTQTRRSD